MNDSFMQAQILLIYVTLGGILGMTGQAIRMIVGLKKENEVQNERARVEGRSSVSYYDSLSGKRLTISLLIGFVAGLLAFLFLCDDKFQIILSKANVLAIIASGYSGVDFIEGFMNKYLPDTSGQKPEPAAATANSDSREEVDLQLPSVPAR